MEWVAFVALLSFVVILPSCWLMCNRACGCMSPQVAERCRRAARAYLVALFVCVWAATSTTSEGGAWQIPLYASFPLVMTLSRSRVTGCVLLLDVAGALVATLISLLISSVVWSSRGSSLGQGVVLCAMQPPVSEAASVLQQRNAGVMPAHLLEIVVLLRVFASGAFVSETYTVWKESVFAFVAYIFGICAVTLVVLFVAPRWKCACAPQTEAENTEQQKDSSAVEMSSVAIVVDDVPVSPAPLHTAPTREGAMARSKTEAKHSTDTLSDAETERRGTASLSDWLPTLPPSTASPENLPSKATRKDMARRMGRLDFKERERRR